MGKGQGGNGALLPTSLAETWFDRLTKFYLIPDGPFLSNWERFMVLIALIDCILISYMIAFNQYSIEAWISCYLIDVAFFVDIYIKFHVAYLQNGLWVVFSKEMALNYLYSNEFKFDVISNIPYDLIAFGWIHDPEPGNVRYILGLVRTVKMVRVFMILKYFRRQEQKLHAGYGIQIIKFIFYLITLEHCVACMWFALACPRGTAESCNDPSWVMGSEASLSIVVGINSLVDKTTTPWSFIGAETTRYIQSIYWTVTTMTTTGYGDITAKNEPERIFSLFTMILGILFYGYVSGTIASSLSNVDSRRVAYLQKITAIRQYMNDRDMDSDMQDRVLEYYDYMWERNKGIDVKNLFEDMPNTFKSEVALSLNNSIIEKASIFGGCSIGFRRKIATSMKLYLFTANEYVIHKGDLGAEMFFITQGRIDIFWTTDLQRPTASLIEGAHFGEFQIILGHKHEYSARAVCNTDIYVLSREDIEVAFNAFPEDKNLVISATSKRYNIALSSRTSKDFDPAANKGPSHPLVLKDAENEFGACAPSLQANINSAQSSKRQSGFLVKSAELSDDSRRSLTKISRRQSFKEQKDSIFGESDLGINAQNGNAREEESGRLVEGPTQPPNVARQSKNEGLIDSHISEEEKDGP